MTNEGWGFDDHCDSAFFVPVLRRRAGLWVYRLRSLIFCLGHVPAWQRLGTMNDMQILIEQLISDISGQAARLDESRLQMFLTWLAAHSSLVKTGEQVEVAVPEDGSLDDRLRIGLKGWFESLPLQGLLWEYRLLLEEIDWLRDLDPRSFPQDTPALARGRRDPDDAARNLNEDGRN